MASSNTYFIDVNSNYRDMNRYPNPCDFGITFQTNQSTRIHDDRCGVDSFYRQSVGPGFWATTNLVPNASDVVPQALNNPTIIAKEGYGLLPKNIDAEPSFCNGSLYGPRPWRACARG